MIALVFQQQWKGMVSGTIIHEYQLNFAGRDARFQTKQLGHGVGKVKFIEIDWNYDGKGLSSRIVHDLYYLTFQHEFWPGNQPTMGFAKMRGEAIYMVPDSLFHYKAIPDG
jgi:hypothetical protein